jgi:leader peptidase (prepilin peptidase)/N-methyltransferase
MSAGSAGEPIVNTASHTASRSTYSRLLQSAITPTAVAIAMAVLAFASLPLDRAIVAALAATALVVLSTIDLERRIIPNRIVLPAAAVVLLAQLALFPGHALEWALAPLLAALFLVLPQLFNRASIGMGDVKLGLLMGTTLGWAVFSALIVAFLCAFPIALLTLVRGGAEARKATIPLGPFLSLGTLFILFAPHISGLPGS